MGGNNRRINNQPAIVEDRRATVVVVHLLIQHHKNNISSGNNPHLHLNTRSLPPGLIRLDPTLEDNRTNPHPRLHPKLVAIGVTVVGLELDHPLFYSPALLRDTSTLYLESSINKSSSVPSFLWLVSFRYLGVFLA